MIIFKEKKNLIRDNKHFEKLLSDRLLILTQAPIYFFPFCFFTKSFYIDLKESRKGFFEGEIKNGYFNLSLTGKIFSNRRRLPLKIKGEIQNNSVKIEYHIPALMILVVIALIMIDLFFVEHHKLFDNVFYTISGLLITIYFFKVIRIRNIIDRICN